MVKQLRQQLILDPVATVKIRRALEKSPSRPDYRYERKGSVTRYKGRTTGLSLSGWFYHVFRENELLPKHQKRNDATIEEELLREFPTTDPEHDDYQGFWKDSRGYNKTIARFRANYNHGHYSSFQMPEHQSFRYNHKGEFIEPKYGRRLLTKDEVKALIRDHLAWWDRKAKRIAAKEEEIRRTHDT